MTAQLTVIHNLILLFLASFLIAKACDGINAIPEMWQVKPAYEGRSGVKCPKCTAAQENARFGSMCGTDLTVAKPSSNQLVCPKCQAQLAGGVRFCY